MPRGLTSPPLRLTCARWKCGKQFYSYPDRRGSEGKHQKFCCRACYNEHRRADLEFRRWRQATLWYWLYGVPYCPGCVTAKTPCLSQEEAARAVREIAPAGARCHCCGKPSFSQSQVSN